MENLAPLAELFDRQFPDYADAPYEKIHRLITALDAPDAAQIVAGEGFASSVRLLGPLIAIKNYKSQARMPTDLQKSLAAIIEIRQTPFTKENLRDRLAAPFTQLIELEGFELPTVSAVFHFCHPQVFPIVDQNVQMACGDFKRRFPGDFLDFETPKLPGTHTSVDNKLAKYQGFMSFIDRVCALQKQSYGGESSHRFVDKALMVLGDKLRKQKKRHERRKLSLRRHAKA